MIIMREEKIMVEYQMLFDNYYGASRDDATVLWCK